MHHPRGHLRAAHRATVAGLPNMAEYRRPFAQLLTTPAARSPMRTELRVRSERLLTGHAACVMPDTGWPDGIVVVVTNPATGSIQDWRGGRIGAMRLGISHHYGWAVAVTASTDYRVVDRRRIELIEPGVPTAPIHHEGGPHLLHRSTNPGPSDGARCNNRGDLTAGRSWPSTLTVVVLTTNSQVDPTLPSG